MTDHKLTLKADIIAAFHDMPEIIQGEPAMREFLRVLQRLILCAQSHRYFCSALNLPHECLPTSSYAVHTQDPYADNYVFPGDVCDFSILHTDNMIWKVTRYDE